MPMPLQYPLERCRALQEKWLRLLHKGVANAEHDDDDDNDEEDAAEEEREPALIREPDRND